MGEDNEKVENIVAFTIFGIIVLLFVGFWTNWFGLASPESNSQMTTTPIQNEPFKGAEDAPVTIVEYSDFECPFCGRFYRNTLKELESRYIESGQVKLVYKNFPLQSMHDRAMPAAIAGECVFRQGNDLFWNFHDLVFENQNNLTDAALKGYARQAGADMDSFTSCYENENTKSEVEQDLKEGSQSGITGTPGFVVGNSNRQPFRGEVLVGSQPVSRFQQLVNKHK